jgi:DNA polymerase-3 subunit epsilon
MGTWAELFAHCAAGDHMTRFVAVDVETANTDYASICQLGIVQFSDEGDDVIAVEQLVNPEDEFDLYLTQIHGIGPEHVREAPTMPTIAPALQDLLGGQVVVSHTPFDRVAISRALTRYSLPQLQCTWLDSARIVRRTWPELQARGYGLANVAEMLGIKFDHHNACEDARACGEIVVRAMEQTGLDLQGWLKRVGLPLNQEHAGPIVADGNPAGALYGEVLVFTGALRLPRRDAAEMAAHIGCDVESNVTKRTTLLVVGDQDARKLAGHERSNKHRKAEQLRAGGQPIRIVTEADFIHLVGVQ